MSSQKYVMVAKTFAGLENVLMEELIEIGASDVEVLIRGVKFSGSKEILYKANFCCRTALRILVIIKEFKVKNANDLYNGVRSVEWPDYFDIQQTFAITSTVNSEAFNNSMFVSLKTKDAIVDNFRAKFGKRPSVNAENPEIRINVHASSDEVSLSLDSSGESLHKRGYRVGQNEASMSEVLAAGILKIAGWKGQCDFYDPMCGSGTLPIEAALIARNIPPGIFRKAFAFEKWKDFDEDIFDKVYNADYEKEFTHNIYASDIAPVNVKISSENARNAGLKKDIQFSVADFATLKPVGENGILVMNPPYGQRMNDRAVEPIYNMIGTSLKNNFRGINTWVISSSEEGFKSIGLKPSARIKLFNGALECELRNFEMYDGSKKASKQGEGRRSYSDNSEQRGNFRRPPLRQDNNDRRRSGSGSEEGRNGRRERTGPRPDRSGYDKRNQENNPHERKPFRATLGNESNNRPRRLRNSENPKRSFNNPEKNDND